MPVDVLWPIEDAGHCAAEKIRPVIAATVAWVVANTQPSETNTMLLRAAAEDL